MKADRRGFRRPQKRCQALPEGLDLSALAGRLLDRQELALVLGVAPTTLESWAVRGTGPQVTYPAVKAPRYALCDVQAWLAQLNLDWREPIDLVALGGRLMTRAEVAEVAGITTRTLSNMTREATHPELWPRMIMLGRMSPRYAVADVRRWLTETGRVMPDAA